MAERSVAGTRPKISVSLLGPLSLACNGEALALPASRKTRALFAYLLLENRTHRRERLCEIFFNVPNDPRAALRWSLSKIRTMLGDCADALKGDRETVCLDPGAFDLDIDGLDGVPVKEGLTAALESPLTGIAWSGSDHYDAWLGAERARIDRFRLDWLRRAEGNGQIDEPSLKRARQEAGLIAADIGESLSIAPAPFDQAIQYCHAEDGVRIAYATFGEGPPLVKAANWLNHLELDWRSPFWDGLISNLAKFRTLLRYDERGNGMSQWDIEDISFESFVTDLETVVDRSGLERFPLLGISQGCAVSIEYAARHPERVSQLILLGGYARGWRHFADEAEAARREAIITLVEHGWGQNTPIYRQLFSQSFFPDATLEELDQFNEFQRKMVSPENAVRLLQTFSNIDVRHRLADIKVPTLVIHSNEDQRIPIALGVELAANIPGASFVTLDSRSHVPLAREPAMTRLLDAIQSFLT